MYACLTRLWCSFGVIPDVADLKKAAIFDPDPVYGLGTWGTASVIIFSRLGIAFLMPGLDRESNWTVTDGAFANMTRLYPWYAQFCIS